MLVSKGTPLRTLAEAPPLMAGRKTSWGATMAATSSSRVVSKSWKTSSATSSTKTPRGCQHSGWRN
eukprot:9069452-Lingulodinium_polyedra.AAC.1